MVTVMFIVVGRVEMESVKKDEGERQGVFPHGVFLGNKPKEMIC